jgi:hypothetical protein
MIMPLSFENLLVDSRNHKGCEDMKYSSKAIKGKLQLLLYKAAVIMHVLRTYRIVLFISVIIIVA